MDVNVQAGNWYVVEGEAGDTVTNPLTGKVIATVEDGKQTAFLATTPYVVTSSDTVGVHKANFNSAPAKLKALGLLGGGSSTGLPAGYLAAEFLEGTGTQYVSNVITLTSKRVVNLDYMMISGTAVNWSSVYGRNDGQSMFYMNTNGTVRIDWDGKETKFTKIVMDIKHNFKIRNDILEIDGVKYILTGKGTTEKSGRIDLWHVALLNGYISPGRFYKFYAESGDGATCNYLPALNSSGIPCMYDTIAHTSKVNAGTGAFIVGLTLAQARKLRLLPSSGGTLKISLPTNWQEDEAVVNAISVAEANGWVFETLTYSAAGGASTYALRRILVKHVQDDNGNYVDANGVRYRVEWCEEVLGTEPEALGYEPFRSVEAACEYWGLEPYVDPAWAEDFLTNN